MTTEEILFDIEDRMEKTIAKLKRELAGIRTGRANPGLVDSVKVVAYGVEVPLKQVATVACPEPTQILIRPFDASTLKDIEKGVMSSELGYAPNNDGKVIRLNIPPLSREVRQKMVMTIRKMSEEAKIAIRNVRRDGNKMVETEEKAKSISEDQRDKTKADIQDLTKKYEDIASEMARVREQEVLED
ncbi:MAG: ribosome recycling factor [Thermoguttaceae bacterium]|jgi:ribosome recycling factor